MPKSLRFGKYVVKKPGFSVVLDQMLQNEKAPRETKSRILRERNL